MTIINVICPECSSIIRTSKGDREFKLSDHIENAHPMLYDEMHDIAMNIARLKKYIHEKTHCFSANVFEPKRGR